MHTGLLRCTRVKQVLHGRAHGNTTPDTMCLAYPETDILFN